MTPASSKMICPNCHIEMNHHADKVMQAFESHLTGHLDEAVEEFHACPRCGRGGSRHARA